MIIEDIEKAVAKLPPDQLAQFRAWFEQFDAARFDQRSTVTPTKDGSIGWPMRQSTICATVVPANYEALREPRTPFRSTMSNSGHASDRSRDGFFTSSWMGEVAACSAAERG
jgi:hypothetical protein